MNTSTEFRTGYVALVGKPNAGKSTLMNRFIGSKISIATYKAQTTRHQIVGIFSSEQCQIIFLDTPGIISPSYELQRAMMASVQRAKTDADVVVLLFDPADKHPADEVISFLQGLKKPLLLAINKSDRPATPETEKEVKSISKRLPFAGIHHISALTGEGVPELLDALTTFLPVSPPFYPEDIISEHPVRFFVSELIREQLFLQFQQEIPYSCAVEVIDYTETEDKNIIQAEIIVNRKSQKGMIIGKGGSAIKKLGIEARRSIEEFIEKPVYLELHVKVREKWREKEQWIRNLGY